MHKHTTSINTASDMLNAHDIAKNIFYHKHIPTPEELAKFSIRNIWDNLPYGERRLAMACAFYEYSAFRSEDLNERASSLIKLGGMIEKYHYKPSEDLLKRLQLLKIYKYLKKPCIVISRLNLQAILISGSGPSYYNLYVDSVKYGKEQEWGTDFQTILARLGLNMETDLKQLQQYLLIKAASTGYEKAISYLAKKVAAHPSKWNSEALKAWGLSSFGILKQPQTASAASTVGNSLLPSKSQSKTPTLNSKTADKN